MPGKRAWAMAMAGAALLATGCRQHASEPAASESAATAPIAPAPAASPLSAPAASNPALTKTPVATMPSTSRDPKEVLIAWAGAVSLRQWLLARAYWGEYGSQSGLEPDEFIARWSVLKDPVIDIGQGREEGAAGSLFYTAPVAIHDGKHTIRGQVVLRRVNDVPGASAEELRWHIESTTLKP